MVKKNRGFSYLKRWQRAETTRTPSWVVKYIAVPSSPGGDSSSTEGRLQDKVQGGLTWQPLASQWPKSPQLPNPWHTICGQRLLLWSRSTWACLPLKATAWIPDGYWTALWFECTAFSRFKSSDMPCQSCLASRHVATSRMQMSRTLACGLGHLSLPPHSPGRPSRCCNKQVPFPTLGFIFWDLKMKIWLKWSLKSLPTEHEVPEHSSAAAGPCQYSETWAVGDPRGNEALIPIFSNWSCV